MAQFKAMLGEDIIRDFEKVYNNTEKIFGEMTKAGAQVVANNVRSSVPLPEMASYVKLTRTYKTPSDGGINTKVYFSGYLPFSGKRTKFTRKGGSGKSYTSTQGVPVAFIANIYEYGRSGAPFPKKPFFRKAFNKGQVEQAMLAAQVSASGGLLTNE